MAKDAPLPPEIEDEQVLGINKEPWHATLMPYGDLKQALAGIRRDSSFARSLNGDWKFHYVPRPEERPVDFYKPDFNVSSWDTLTVPSCWQLFGYGTPIYRNHGYTFEKKDWPRVMTEPPRDYTAYNERNPVGSYRRNFTVPTEWKGRRVFLNFAGVDSAFYLWINGKSVGYSSNSRNPAEFDVTDFLDPNGENSVAVEVYRYNAGSYLEDMDMWRLSGIFRDVTLWSAPNLHIRDFAIVTDLDEAYKNATLKATAKVRNFGKTPTPAASLTVTLYDLAGKEVPGALATVAVPSLGAGEEAKVELSFPVSDPTKWTAETPSLYTSVLTLKEGDKTTELLSSRVGFREIEIKGRLFTVNGVPIKLKGANRHENWPDTGHYVSEERMIEDIKILKQANCNHVRTSHYTNDPHWYELCDEYGLYLVAEANVECHGFMGVLDKEPRFEKAIVDRNVANVENLKNHPSIIIWSLGNECGPGENMKSALKAVKALDLTRPTHYEGFGVGPENPADIDSNMYAGVEQFGGKMSKDLYTKPYYLCEYAHAMFNSMGSTGEYNDVMDKYDFAMGGAIWEWQDQSIWNRRDPKRPFLAYGGGFGDVPNDRFFIHKGIVFGDRSPKPHFPEIKRVYQWIAFAPVDLPGGQISLKNKYAYLDLAKFTGTWTVMEDGTAIDEGQLPALDLAPGKEKELKIPYKMIQGKPGARYWLNLSVKLARDEPWAKAGYDIANAQFELPVSVPAVALAVKPLQLRDAGNRVTVAGEGFTVDFDSSTGLLTSLARGGINVLLPGGGPKLHLWRAAHKNDDNYAATGWEEMGLATMTPQLVSFASEQVNPSTVRVSSTIAYTGKNGYAATHSSIYTITGDGAVTVDNGFSPTGPEINLARIGVRLLLDQRLDQVEYLARGPFENYSDRKRGSDIGRHAGTVAGQMTGYSKPMEQGNHEDMRWVALRGKGLPTLVSRADQEAMQFSALPYDDESMEATDYSVDLPPVKQTVLVLAAKTLGVGSASCGPRPLAQYLVKSAPTVFSYALRLLPETVADVAPAAREALPENRIAPILAQQDGDGMVMILGNKDSISYSWDGNVWKPYKEPFAVDKEALLSLKRTIAGSSVETKLRVAPPMDRRKWKITASDFKEGEGDPQHAIDGRASTIWHSNYNPVVPLPHSLSIDMGAPEKIEGICLLPRQGGDGENGRIKEFELYFSRDGQEWGKPVAKGKLENNQSQQSIKLKGAESTRYFKLVVLSEYSGKGLATVAEISIISAK